MDIIADYEITAEIKSQIQDEWGIPIKEITQVLSDDDSILIRFTSDDDGFDAASGDLWIAIVDGPSGSVLEIQEDDIDG